MKTLIFIFALAGFKPAALANSVDRLCRDKAKEVAEDNYRSCMTESRAARLDEIRKEYKSDLRELKARYEEKIRKLKANNHNRQQQDNRHDNRDNLGDNLIDTSTNSTNNSTNSPYDENQPIERVSLK